MSSHGVETQRDRPQPVRPRKRSTGHWMCGAVTVLIFGITAITFGTHFTSWGVALAEESANHSMAEDSIHDELMHQRERSEAHETLAALSPDLSAQPTIALSKMRLSGDINTALDLTDGNVEKKLPIQVPQSTPSGEITIEAEALSDSSELLAVDQQTMTFEFELSCLTQELVEPTERRFAVRAGEQHRESDLPVDANCTLTEVTTHGATFISMLIAGAETNGVTRTNIIVTDSGVHVRVVNYFDGVPAAASNTVELDLWLEIVFCVVLLLFATGVAIIAPRMRRPVSDMK